MKRVQQLIAAGVWIWCANARAQTFTEFSLPNNGSGPVSIVPGPDRALWFTEYYRNAIGRCGLKGEITEFVLPSPDRRPWGIAAGPDGSLWFTATAAGLAEVGRLTPGGILTEFPLPDPNSPPDGIVAGPDDALWFTEPMRKRIGRISTDGALREFTLSASSGGPTAITLGPDGNLWFVEPDAHKVGSITTEGIVTEYPVVDSDDLREITSGPDGALWCTDLNGGRIFRISLAGAVSQISLPPAKAPIGITGSRDGSLWVAEAGWFITRPDGTYLVPGGIVRIMPPSSLFELSIPNPTAQPNGITVGPDGNIWFTQFAGEQYRPFVRHHIQADTTADEARAVSLKLGVSAKREGSLLTAAPNTSLQRTRSSASRPRSPLSSQTLGSNEHRKSGGRRGKWQSSPRYTIGGTLSYATPSVFHQRHIGRVLRSS